MTGKRKVFNAILSLLAIILMGTAACLTWLPPLVSTPAETNTSFGTFENRRIVEQTGGNGQKTYLVEDSAGRFLFNIPLRDYLIDTRFRNGELRFRDETTGKEGFIDSCGYVTFIEEENADMIVADTPSAPESSAGNEMPKKTSPSVSAKQVLKKCSPVIHSAGRQQKC